MKFAQKHINVHSFPFRLPLCRCYAEVREEYIKNTHFYGQKGGFRHFFVGKCFVLEEVVGTIFHYRVCFSP